MKTATLFLALPLVMASSTASLQPVKWSVVGGSGTRQVMAGRTVAVTVKADIAKGWHIYSLSQEAGGPIPLTLKLAGAADVQIRGTVKAPKPDRTFDKNFGIQTELYSGDPRFTLALGVPANALRGIRRVQIQARYQVCSDRLCLPAKTEKMDVSVFVTRGK